MNNLKTLKDLPRCDANSLCRYENIHVDVIKAEAVKWVKSSLGYGIGEFESMEDYERTMNWIKHFFNLTEDDLKEGVGK